jgi:hypothetical protein
VPGSSSSPRVIFAAEPGARTSCRIRRSSLAPSGTARVLPVERRGCRAAGQHRHARGRAPLPVPSRRVLRGPDVHPGAPGPAPSRPSTRQGVSLAKLAEARSSTCRLRRCRKGAVGHPCPRPSAVPVPSAQGDARCVRSEGVRSATGRSPITVVNVVFDSRARSRGLVK